MAKKIMIQGTASNVGKSILCAGLCRIFAQDGFAVAPFKAQNMALNSAVTSEGLEMGRAQVVQAQACGIAPTVDMNPVLLKPTGDMNSQVIVRGIPRGQMRAKEYYNYKAELIPDVLASFTRLDTAYDIIVIEGAGSPAEINLQKDDFVNMGLAKMVGSPVLLVGDIDRGGVFASLYGTIKLLTAQEQDLISGLIINKFRGDLEILRPGLAPLEEMTGKEICGVIPMMELEIDDEDSLSGQFLTEKKEALLDIAVVHFPSISNFTDFNPLNSHTEVNLRYVRTVAELGKPDLVILPGTKNTISDLAWLKMQGLASEIMQLAKNATPIMGICGGYQMLGQRVNDPCAVEGGGSHEGLGLLSGTTVFQANKTMRQITGSVKHLEGIFAPLSGSEFTGYEIHMGQTTPNGGNLELINREGEIKTVGDSSENIWGCYIHGIFEQGEFRKTFLECLLKGKGISAEIAAIDWDVQRNQQYDKLADTMRKHLDMDKIYRILGI